MNKIHMKVVSVEEEPTQNGGMHLRIKVKSNEKIYIFGVREEDYLDENTRQRFHQKWIQTIKKAQIRARKNEKTVASDKEKIRSLVGAEVDEREY